MEATMWNNKVVTLDQFLIEQHLSKLESNYFFLHQIQNIHEQYSFFYDETNNIGKLYLSHNEKLNIEDKKLKDDFILGGIVFRGNSLPSYENLRDILGIQKEQQELKSKNFIKKNFSYTMKSEKIGKILKILKESRAFLHFKHANILFYSIVDIVDSIPQAIEFHVFLEKNRELKDWLFFCVKDNLDIFKKIALKYEFPNIPQEKHYRFIKELANKMPILCLNSDWYGLMSLIDSKVDLTFLQYETTNNWCNDFPIFYLTTPSTFIHSKHVFDIELTVMDRLQYNQDEKSKIIEFTDSANSIHIQLSDIMMGIVRQFLSYIKNQSIEKIDTFLDKMTEMQKNNLKLFTELITRSLQESHGFVMHIAPISEKRTFDMFLYKLQKFFSIS